MVACFSSMDSDKELWERIEQKKERSREPVRIDSERSVLTKMMAERSLMRVLLLVFLPFVVDWNGHVLGLFRDRITSIMSSVALVAIGILAIASFNLYRCLDHRLSS